MKWIDTYEIVDALLEKYPEKNPEKILFTDLRNLVSNLKGFDDELDKCNERIPVSYTHLTLPTKA